MPGVSGVTVVTTLVCCFYFAHKAAGALSARHSLRPLIFRGEGLVHNPGALRRGIVSACFAVIASEAKQSILSLCGTMDCFASLAMTVPIKLLVIRSTTGLTFTGPDVISTRPARPGFWRWNLERKMTGTTRSSGGLDDRRKRLLFRCWHRGTREMDLILGRFADAEIAHLTGEELDQLERLIEVPDPDLYAALTGAAPLAPQHAGRLFDRIKSFSPGDHGA